MQFTVYFILNRIADESDNEGYESDEETEKL